MPEQPTPLKAMPVPNSEPKAVIVHGRYIVVDLVADLDAASGLSLNVNKSPGMTDDELAVILMRVVADAMGLPADSYRRLLKEARRAAQPGGGRPDMISDRLGYPPEVGDEAWRHAQAARDNRPSDQAGGA